MISLDDPKWRQLKGGYKVPYDASIALRRLEDGEDVWDELWQELHHQGNVGEASYAAIPHLVRIGDQLPKRDWNLYGLIATIEIERHRKSNPPIPDWLKDDYSQAFERLLELALSDLASCTDRLTIQSIFGAIALCKGDVRLGTLLSHSDDSEIEEYLDKTHAWSDLYRESV